MTKSVKIRTLTITTIIMLILSACGAESTPDPTISTAVALTVAAQNAQSANTDAAPPAATPEPTNGPLQFIPTLTPLVSIASPTLSKPVNTSNSECARASFVSETIPDGTIYKPGTQFTKTWDIKNESGCTWDTSYKIVFWNGDVLGGGYVYNLPQTVPPGATFPISLVLTAPTTDGPYTSEWMLQTPAGEEFGVGEYSVPFTANIIVSSDTKQEYAITSVEYTVERVPASGCPANVDYFIHAAVTSNGPIEIGYQWLLGSGTPETILEKPVKTLKFTEAGTKTVTHQSRLHLGATPGNQRWKALVIVEPYYQEFYHVNFLYDCGDY
jgi:hypothetical protein